ncbi:MAG: transcription-repair coupling factor [Alistipes sp.]|jgi:transcription-repair coupling factor (superfamily II helicase)|nr:transcription-repair coupling factor [Alistipes sp.]
MNDLKSLIRNSKQAEELKKCLENIGSTVHLEQMVGGVYSLYAAEIVEQMGGIHIFLADDRDTAAYLVNDLYELLDEERVGFFASGYKRSAAYGAEDAQGIVRRTAALNAITNFKDGYLAICTYPEALAETVVDESDLVDQSLHIAVGDTIEQNDLVDWLINHGFTRLDFVYEPGQYSVRGGIVDVFSYAESKPYRIDFFGNTVDSLRRFDISSQLSAERPDTVDIIPNIHQSEDATERVSLARFASGATWWLNDGDFALRKIADIRKRILEMAESEEDAQKLAKRVTSRQSLLKDWETSTLTIRKNNIRERQATASLVFETSPQPAFNRNFEMLADDIRWNNERGYTTTILSHNKAQIERLTNIFHQVGRRNIEFRSEDLVLHEGFVDNALKVCIYTDHQIFDRYQRYRIRGEIKRDEQMTVAELNALKVGDYVVHIDHGVGRFGGLVKLNENGRTKEAIKLIYKDNDILFVNVHALHRISRYKSGEGEPPKIYKLGNGAWQKLKATTKKAVKDISRELIALYAKRKASKGFAFSEDSYLQHELEASFKWEDTPDQQTAIAAVKRDMESEQPMDRLVCGDVGFGKTEVAIRAAFKAACDGKQTAVLVPTTILALQHYRSFSERLRDLPVTVEYINRTKSAKEARRIADDLKAGKIDILIGTHKMLSKQIEFHDLGLLIIDEEQKFGVAAKEKLTQLSVAVDTLTLTATPIPRTLQFSLMGSRDLSVISTPPPNRQPIVTESHVFSEDVIRDAIEEELSRGGQVYFVHNRVEDIMNIEGLITRLCPKARVGVGHGRMPAEQLEKLIMDFIYGEFDVLLATTIIENGIDIANANTIIINDAHRFGLSDLHQLRGRVGRSDKKGFCYLISPPDELIGDDARRRLRAIEEFSDLGSGFNIAMQDLDIRGAGNLLGAEQSGFIADIGIETYQKILNQAISELRAEGLDTSGLSQAENDAMKDISFVDDATIDIDVDASIPDSYVRSQSEKLRLYREIDAMHTDEQFAALMERLKDRFGAIPEPVRVLTDVVRLRHEAVNLGMEHVKVKNGLMIVRFVGDNNSPFFKTDTFLNMLRKVVSNPERFVVKQYNNRLSMTVRKINSVAEAVDMLRTLSASAKEE